MADKFRYFKITASTEADRLQLIEVLKSKIFYPDANSTPPLPAIDALNTYTASVATGTLNINDFSGLSGSFNLKSGGNIINKTVITFDSAIEDYNAVGIRIGDSINAYSTHTAIVDGSGITISSIRMNTDENLPLIIESVTGDIFNATVTGFSGGTYAYESYDFDFRQFFKCIGNDIDGMPIVKTRDDYEENEFTHNIITPLEWLKYYLSEVPTVTGIVYNEVNDSGRNTKTDIDGWLSYQYPPRILS